MGTRGPVPKGKTVIWSADFAYAVGLMTADGSLSANGRHLSFASKEIEQIENFKKCLGLSVKTGIIYSKNLKLTEPYYRVQWGNVVLYQFFLSIGLTPNKSLTQGPLLIPKQYFMDFLRGLYDGDGCFYSYFDPRWEKSFMFYLSFASGSSEFITWLQSEIQEATGLVGHRTRAKSQRYFQLKYAKKETLQLLGKIYEKSEAPHLKRKKLKIVRALRIVGLGLPAPVRKSVKYGPGC